MIIKKFKFRRVVVKKLKIKKKIIKVKRKLSRLSGGSCLKPFGLLKEQILIVRLKYFIKFFSNILNKKELDQFLITILFKLRRLTKKVKDYKNLNLIMIVSLIVENIEPLIGIKRVYKSGRPVIIPFPFSFKLRLFTALKFIIFGTRETARSLKIPFVNALIRECICVFFNKVNCNSFRNRIRYDLIVFKNRSKIRVFKKFT